MGPRLAMPDSWPNNSVERTVQSVGTIPMRGSVPAGRYSPAASVPGMVQNERGEVLVSGSRGAEGHKKSKGPTRRWGLDEAQSGRARQRTGT